VSVRVAVDCDQSTTQAKARTPVDQVTEVSSTVGAKFIMDRHRSPVLSKPTSRHGPQPLKHNSSLLDAVNDVDERPQSRSGSSLTSDAQPVDAVTGTVCISAPGGLSASLDQEKLPENLQLRRQTSEPVKRAGIEVLSDPSSTDQPASDQKTGVGSSGKSANEAGATSVREDSGNRSLYGEASVRRVMPLDAEQIERVELFYASHATQVFVCRCLAYLYFTSATGSFFKNCLCLVYRSIGQSINRSINQSINQSKRFLKWPKWHSHCKDQ